MATPDFKSKQVDRSTVGMTMREPFNPKDPFIKLLYSDLKSVYEGICALDAVGPRKNNDNRPKKVEILPAYSSQDPIDNNPDYRYLDSHFYWGISKKFSELKSFLESHAMHVSLSEELNGFDRRRHAVSLYWTAIAENGRNRVQHAAPISMAILESDVDNFIQGLNNLIADYKNLKDEGVKGFSVRLEIYIIKYIDKRLANINSAFEEMGTRLDKTPSFSAGLERVGQRMKSIKGLRQHVQLSITYLRGGIVARLIRFIV